MVLQSMLGSTRHHLVQTDHTPGRGILLCNENGIGSNFLERGRWGVGGEALRLTGKYSMFSLQHGFFSE